RGWYRSEASNRRQGDSTLGRAFPWHGLDPFHPSNCAPVRASPGRGASPGSTRRDLRTPLHRLPPARETRSWLPAERSALATETADRLVPGRSLAKLRTTSRRRPDLEERSARDRRRACA